MEDIYIIKYVLFFLAVTTSGLYTEYDIVEVLDKGIFDWR